MYFEKISKIFGRKIKKSRLLGYRREKIIDFWAACGLVRKMIYSLLGRKNKRKG